MAGRAEHRRVARRRGRGSSGSPGPRGRRPRPRRSGRRRRRRAASRRSARARPRAPSGRRSRGRAVTRVARLRVVADERGQRERDHGGAGDAEDAPETIEKRTLVSDATTPASTLPSSASLATWANSMPVSRPRMVSGVAASRIVLRRIALTKSAAPAAARKTQREPEAVREAERGDRHPPQPRPRCTTREPLAAHVRAPTPSRATRASAPTFGAEYRKPTSAGAAAELRREGREQRARHSEDHRVRVDDEDPEQRLAAS